MPRIKPNAIGNTVDYRAKNSTLVLATSNVKKICEPEIMYKGEIYVVRLAYDTQSRATPCRVWYGRTDGSCELVSCCDISYTLAAKKLKKILHGVIAGTVKTNC